MKPLQRRKVYNGWIDEYAITYIDAVIIGLLKLYSEYIKGGFHL